MPILLAHGYIRVTDLGKEPFKEYEYRVEAADSTGAAATEDVKIDIYPDRHMEIYPDEYGYPLPDTLQPLLNTLFPHTASTAAYDALNKLLIDRVELPPDLGSETLPTVKRDGYSITGSLLNDTTIDIRIDVLK